MTLVLHGCLLAPADSAMERMPAELWRIVFDNAVMDDELFDRVFRDSLEDCVWYQSIYGTWNLRTPEECIRQQQRQSFATKKVRGGTGVRSCAGFIPDVDAICRR